VLQRQRVLQAVTKVVLKTCYRAACDLTSLWLEWNAGGQAGRQESWLRGLEGAPETAARPP
jgi:hypothetical protein